MVIIPTPFPSQSFPKAWTMDTDPEGLLPRALGDDYMSLHPMVQARLGTSVEKGIACIGEGVMTRMKPGPAWLRPVLRLLKGSHSLLPDRGENVPFVIENYPYRDPQGQESLTFVHTFYFPKVIRRLDMYLTRNEGHNAVTGYVGRSRRLITPMSLGVNSQGHLRVRSGKLKLRLGKWTLPIGPGFYSEIEEWYDPAEDCMRIRNSVAHPFLGGLYRYEGWYRFRFVKVDGVPAHAMAR